MRRLLAFLFAAFTAVSLPIAAIPSATNDRPRGPSEKKEEIVAFNVKSKKYHCLRCGWAKRCTANCIDVALSIAKAHGGVPCKVCGGTCGVGPAVER